MFATVHVMIYMSGGSFLVLWRLTTWRGWLLYFACVHDAVCVLGLDARKPVLRGFANNKDADHPAHTQISAFVVRLMKNIISRLATSKISIF